MFEWIKPFNILNSNILINVIVVYDALYEKFIKKLFVILPKL